MRRIPSFPSLRAFEAAARLGSFARASQELCLTPSAVSHQVRALERHLGRALFRRENRQATLTADGERLLAGLSRAFDGIEAACAVLAANRGIDLTLLDLSMRGVTGFDGLITIRASFPRIPILIVSGHEDPRIVREALQHGAAGFVPKAMDKATLTRAITEVMSGALFLPPGLAEAGAPAPRSKKAPLPERLARLTPQQLRVLMMIRQGKLNKKIAHELQVGDSTVKAHVSEILRKLEVISRTQIVIDTASLDFDQIHNSHSA